MLMINGRRKTLCTFGQHLHALNDDCSLSVQNKKTSTSSEEYPLQKQYYLKDYCFCILRSYSNFVFPANGHGTLAIATLIKAIHSTIFLFVFLVKSQCVISAPSVQTAIKTTETVSIVILPDFSVQTPSTQQSLNLKFDDAMIPKMMMTTVRMKTRMEPSIATTLYTSSIEESPSNVPTEFQREYPTVSSDEPYLYLLPKTIHATYQPLPFFLKATLGFLSLMIAYVSTWQRQLTWLHPLLVIKNKQVNIVKGLAFFSKVLILYSIGRVIMQDVFTPPSRITTTSLQTNYWLPSSLSTYSNGIHSLQYHSKPSMSAKFQAMHLNHGFGASSLSWLPAIPKLAERLHVRHTMAHDAPGFGFTDSSKDRRSDTSSDIGIQLIQEIIGNDQESLLLMGHSMGALTTLQMVAKLPKTTKLWIVLVAPALGLRKKSSGNNGESKIIEQRLLDPVIEYVLKRVVG